MTKVTMRDVARLAGVSVATVSAVINGGTKVSQLRSDRVRQAMEALDYYPDQVARSLKVGKTGVIGMVIPDITNTFFPEMIRGAEDVARRHGYSVILCDSSEDPAQESLLLNTLFSRRVDGVLMACSDASAAYDRLMRRRFPIVFLDRIPRGLNHSAVSTDNVGAGCEATHHLIQLGHERIAFITGRLGLSPHAGRLEGFRRAMQAANLPIRESYLCPGDGQIETGTRIGTQLLRMETPPTGIISSSHNMLLGLMRAIAQIGLSCPSDVSVVGFDDSAWSMHYTPRLTVIAQMADEIGKTAVEMLLQKMREPEGETRQPDMVLVPAELRVRDSTCPPHGAA
ncbi:MAG: LacI family DNA-binding transcriptional regulator [Bryobacteraceae bacterium]